MRYAAAKRRCCGGCVRGPYSGGLTRQESSSTRGGRPLTRDGPSMGDERMVWVGVGALLTIGAYWLGYVYERWRRG